MNADPIDRVFGRERLKMVTGAHVEVYREAAAPGESRRYTKRFLTTAEGDYAQWTEREWRILARLIGHGTRCVPDVVQYDRGAYGTKLVQTYDAGATVDQWATLMPVERDGRTYAHVFEDCAHWWALAHQCLVALDEIHSLELVHLDVKGDNICIPVGPAGFDPFDEAQKLHVVFHRLALIDFAFSLVSGETLATALPIGWQQDYDYQSPRLLQALEAGRAGDLEPTESLDWRCDMYSLAAMLKRYLPREERLCSADLACGWTAQRYHAAKTLILRVRDAHDAPLPAHRPHRDLIAQTAAELAETDLSESLERGWTLARDVQPQTVPALPLTPITRLAPTQVTLVIPPRDDALAVRARAPARPRTENPSRRRRAAAWIAATAIVAAVAIAAVSTDVVDRLGDAAHPIVERARALSASDAPPPPAVAKNNAAHDEPAAQPVPSKEDEPNAPASNEPAATQAESSPAAHAPPSAESRARAAPEPKLAAPRPKPMPAARFARAQPAPKPVPAPKVADAPLRAPLARASTPSRSPSSVVARYEASLAALLNAAKRSATIATPAREASPPVAAAVAQLAPTHSETAVAPKASAEPAVASVAQLAAAPSETPTAPKASAEPAAVPEPPKPPSAPVPQVAEPPRQPLTRAPIAAARSSLREAPVARASAETNDEDRYRARAQSILATALPRASEQARAQIARVLWLAAGAQRQADESFVVEAVARTGAGDPTLFSHDWAPADGRRLHEAARRAYWSRGQLAEALDLELRAFGANPNDAEIASELALLYLRVTPAEAERARGLALHAIRLQAGRPAGSARVEPWLTFAVASALTGRVSDATQALYVALALAPSVERVCRAAQGALSAYGERVREPVEATLYRLRMQGRDEASPYCALPAGLVQRYRYQ